MRKKVMSLLLTLSIILGGLLPGMALAETGSTWNPSGDVYKISTADDLVNFLNGLEKNGGYRDKTIQLETDINIDDSAVVYDSMAASYKFCGTFDGQGHTISCTEDKTTGLFQSMGDTGQAGVIRNLRLSWSIKDAAARKAYGLLCNTVYGGESVIENCFVEGKIAVTGASCNAGGLIGTLDRNIKGQPTVKNCLVEAEVSTTLNTGGLNSVGAINAENSLFTGTLEGKTVRGLTLDTSMLTNAYYDSTKVTNATCKDPGKTTEELMVLKTQDNLYAGWDDSVWSFKEGSYPALKLFEAAEPSGDTWDPNPADGVYKLSTASDLVNFMNSLEKNDYDGKQVILLKNIDASSAEFEVAASSYGFCGTFDGQSHTISSSSEKNTGLFKALGKTGKAGTIKNLGLNWSIRDTTQSRAAFGLLCNTIYSGDSLIENCTVEGKLTVTGATCNAGGLIGTLDRNITGQPTVKNCLVKADVDTTYSVGGLNAVGAIKAENSLFVGTLAGKTIRGLTMNTSTVTSAYYDSTKVTGAAYTDPGKTSEELMVLKTKNNLYRDWDDSVWFFKEGDYPSLNQFGSADGLLSLVTKAKEISNNGGLYTDESFTALQAAIKGAEDFTAAGDTYKQTEVAAQTEALQSAMDGLKYNVDQQMLKDKVNEYKGLTLNKDQYEEGAVDAFNSALTKAEETANKPNPSGEEIAEAYKALIDAKDTLDAKEYAGEKDKQTLTETIAASEASHPQVDYTADSYKAYASALESAQKTAAKNPLFKKEADEALKSLQTAESTLALAPVSKKALDSAISNAEALDSSLYTATSYNAFKEKIAEAKAVSEDPAVDRQSVVNAQVEALNTAREALVLAADITDLKNQIERSAYFLARPYTDESLNHYKAMLEAAEAYNNQDVPAASQAQVNQAAADLLNASVQLVTTDPANTFHAERGEFVISTLDDLNAFRMYLNYYAFDGETVVLNNDINAAGDGLLTLEVLENSSGSEYNNRAFTGTFDGQGHSILNFHDNHVGLFYQLGLRDYSDEYGGKPAVVRNLHLNVNVDNIPKYYDGSNQGYRYAPLASNLYSQETLVENCWIDGQIKKEDGSVDAVIAKTYMGQYRNCLIAPNITAKGAWVFLGSNEGLTVENCLVNGAIQADQIQAIFEASHSHENVKIINSFYNSDIIGASEGKDAQYAKTGEELKKAATFAEWPKETWKIVDGEFPMLRAFTDQADTSALSAKLDEAKGKTEASYTPASFEALQTAIASAEAVLGDLDATQEAVDDQVQALQTALDGLIEAPDKAGLQALITQAEARLLEEGYTASSYTGLRTALEAASAVNENPEASKAMVEEQQTLLNTALEGMKEAADITELQAEIQKADSFAQKKDSYSADSYAAFKAALDTAGELNSADTEKDQQKEVDQAVENLKAAEARLVFVGDLNQLLEEYSSLKASDYTTAAWTEFEAVMAKASETAAKGDITQEETNSMANALIAAKAALDMNKLGDRGLLETAVKEAKEAVNPENKDSYKPTTYAPYEVALAEAETLLKKSELTETEVSEAIEKLNTARNNVELRADTKNLQALYDQAKDKDEKAYTEATYASLAQTIKAAETVLANPDASQEMVTSAESALSKALTDLRMPVKETFDGYEVITEVPDGTKLTVEKAGDIGAAQNMIAQKYENGTLAALFHITAEPAMPDGMKLKLTLKIPKEAQGYDRYVIYHKPADKAEEYLENASFDKDQHTLTFESTLSDFGIVGLKKAQGDGQPVNPDNTGHGGGQSQNSANSAGTGIAGGTQNTNTGITTDSTGVYLAVGLLMLAAAGGIAVSRKRFGKK